jgi:hypothetical protein
VKLMTERSAEQAPVQTHPDHQDGHQAGHQDTTRTPLAERLQRRISAAAENRAAGHAAHEAARESSSSSRVLPPMPPELRREESQSPPAETPQARSAAPVQSAPRATAQPVGQPAGGQPAAVDQTAPVPVTRARPAATTRRTTSTARAPRRARLRLSRIDPWSVMKVSFLLSIAFGIVTVVSVFLVWSVLGAAGVWSSINNTVSDTVSSGNTVSTFNIEDYLGMSRVLGFTMLVSVIDVVLITAIATLAAFLYNMAASLLGGIEVTLAEDA